MELQISLFMYSVHICFLSLLIRATIYGSDFSPAFFSYVLNPEREFGNIFLAPQTGPPAKILIKKVNAQLIWSK